MRSIKAMKNEQYFRNSLAFSEYRCVYCYSGFFRFYLNIRFSAHPRHEKPYSRKTTKIRNELEFLPIIAMGAVSYSGSYVRIYWTGTNLQQTYPHYPMRYITLEWPLNAKTRNVVNYNPSLPGTKLYTCLNKFLNAHCIQ